MLLSVQEKVITEPVLVFAVPVFPYPVNDFNELFTFRPSDSVVNNSFHSQGGCVCMCVMRVLCMVSFDLVWFSLVTCIAHNNIRLCLRLQVWLEYQCVCFQRIYANFTQYIHTLWGVGFSFLFLFVLCGVYP